MAIYLNTTRPFENFKELFSEKYFVDKSEIISLLNKKISTKSKYLCVTRPRRFGKSSVVDMLGAYYGKAVDAKEIFDNLKVSKADSYEENLNRYNVITISFNEICDNMQTYQDYINNIIIELKREIIQLVNNDNLNEADILKRILQKSEKKFIFIFDEWDYIFCNNLFTENQNDFLEFLRNLLKDQNYVALCYMTGVLPIKKYSSGSALNMFDEYTFLRDRSFGEFFGFTEEEVKELCLRNEEMDF